MLTTACNLQPAMCSLISVLKSKHSDWHVIVIHVPADQSICCLQIAGKDPEAYRGKKNKDSTYTA